MKSTFHPHVRYQFTEFTLESDTVGMVEDLENENAWIQSTEIRPVRQ